MRRVASVLTILVAFMAAAAPLAEANKFGRLSGFTFQLTAGQSAAVKVTGFQGCTFTVLHTNTVGKGATNPAVATVMTSVALSKKQVVTITAVDVGETVIMLQTQGESPSCNNFTAMYFVSVVPDQKAFDKEIKTKFKDALGEAKTGISETLSVFCEQVNFIAKGVKAGTTTADDALGQVTDAMQFVADFFDVVLDDLLDDAFVDIWSCVFDAGYLDMDSDLAGLFPGGCGDWDKFEGKVRKLEEKAILKMEKKYKALVKAIDKTLKGDDDELVQIIEHMHPAFAVMTPVTVPVPMPNPPPPPPPKKLKKNFTSSGRLSSSPMTRLHIGGSADPAGGDVTVEITGPGGAVTTVTATVNNPGCDWEVNFPALPPGSYKVKLSQAGTDSVTFTTLGA